MSCNSLNFFLISITLSVFLIILSTFFLFKSSKQKPISPENQEKHDENTLISSADTSCNDLGDIDISPQKNDEKGQDLLIGSQDLLYSESESLDRFSSTSSEEDDRSSDTEWPYNNTEQRFDCSDDSISDEESLIEIAIPSGQFVSPEKDPIFNLKCCKLISADDDYFLADINEMNEEDNLIEIDIYMGSIKCSSFAI